MATDFQGKVDAYLSGVEQLRAAVQGMTHAELLAQPIEGRWSTLQVVCHLVDSEVAWTHRMKRVLVEDRPLLIGYDETRFTAGLDYQNSDLDFELDLFSKLRQQMANHLRKAPTSSWSRTGVHNETGLLTLEKMVQTEIDHVAHHVKHIEAKRRALGHA